MVVFVFVIAFVVSVMFVIMVILVVVVNSFGAMVPYMRPICAIRYAMRRRKIMIYTPLESQRQDLSFWGSNSGNQFNRNYTNPTTVS